MTPKSWGDVRDWIPTTISEATQKEIFEAAGLSSIYGVRLVKLDTDEFFDNETVYGIKQERGLK